MIGLFELQLHHTGLGKTGQVVTRFRCLTVTDVSVRDVRRATDVLKTGRGRINQHCEQSHHRLRETEERGKGEMTEGEEGGVAQLAQAEGVLLYLPLFLHSPPISLSTSVLPSINHSEDFKLFNTLAGMMTKWYASWINAFKGFSARQVKMFMTMTF